MSARTFKVRMSERCFRFKPDALGSHAPQKPGVYEFVTFDPSGKAEVLYVGLALSPETVFSLLGKHMMGQAKPTAQDLFAAAKDVYFDYVADADIESLDELKDIAGAFVRKHKPRFNAGAAEPSSGKHAAVDVQELD